MPFLQSCFPCFFTAPASPANSPINSPANSPAHSPKAPRDVFTLKDGVINNPFSEFFINDGVITRGDRRYTDPSKYDVERALDDIKVTPENMDVFIARNKEALQVRGARENIEALAKEWEMSTTLEAVDIQEGIQKILSAHIPDADFTTKETVMKNIPNDDLICMFVIASQSPTLQQFCQMIDNLPQ